MCDNSSSSSSSIPPAEPLPASSRSEVALLLAQITTEYEAAVRGMYGFSQGASRHCFITARMENMGRLHSQLNELVGDDAIALVAARLDQCQERPECQL